LNDDQFKVAVLLACATFNVLPDCTALALPELKKPLTPLPQLVATQGTGNAVAGKGEAAVAYWVSRMSDQHNSPARGLLHEVRP
jgi:hypothetical protein